ARRPHPGGGRGRDRHPRAAAGLGARGDPRLLPGAAAGAAAGLRPRPPLRPGGDPGALPGALRLLAALRQRDARARQHAALPDRPGGGAHRPRPGPTGPPGGPVPGAAPARSGAVTPRGGRAAVRAAPGRAIRPIGPGRAVPGGDAFERDRQAALNSAVPSDPGEEGPSPARARGERRAGPALAPLRPPRRRGESPPPGDRCPPPPLPAAPTGTAVAAPPDMPVAEAPPSARESGAAVPGPSGAPLDPAM